VKKVPYGQLICDDNAAFLHKIEFPQSKNTINMQHSHALLY